MLTTIASVVSPLLVAGIAAAGASPAPTPVDALLHDVTSLRSGGNPASLVAWGDAEALLVAGDADHVEGNRALRLSGRRGLVLSDAALFDG
ncbi:MAG: hypothetical protein KDA05_08470, partial [Phycisphaerales bacterium]|nr:hypothetical protein [Phycisphaerales bacterium]